MDLKELAHELTYLANSAYCSMIDQSKKSLCLGEAIKLEKGLFTRENLDAHRKASELYGRHLGLAAAAKMVRDMAGDWDECSICRRKHGPDVTHPAE